MIKRYALLAAMAACLCLSILLIPTFSSTALSADPKPSSQNSPGLDDQVTQAILKSIGDNQRYVQSGFIDKLQITRIKVSADKQWATAWIVYYDSKVEAVIPTEPGLAVVHYLDNSWQVVLSSEPGWQDAISLTPDDLLSKDEKEMWLVMNQGSVEAYPTQAGYYLPWHGGQAANLSRSVGHDADFSTAHFAFDFYFPGDTVCPGGANEGTSGTNGLNFSIYAASAGTVWGWDDSVTDCDHSKANFIVLQNSDDPTIFQLYMHLSQGSIPSALKTVGTPVVRGQFIAIADNTGISTGSHLHFQIEHQPGWPPENPYWNTALDVTFNDVNINGGRPRANPWDGPYCRENDICNTFQTTYVSGNYYMGDSTPPIGTLSGITTGEIVETQKVMLSGYGMDDLSGLDFGQFIANFDGAWHNLGPQFNPGIAFEWDLCAPGLPVMDGAVSVAMLLYDVAGNAAPRAGLTHFTKNYTCPVPPPMCIPDQDQVTLFENPYYQGGCVKFDIGNYPNGGSLNPLGNDDADSILVGSNVLATLYSEQNYSGHSQAVSADKGFFQYEWVPSNTLSSMKVSLGSTAPQAPVPITPLDSSIFREGDVIPFSWRNGGGAVEYQVEIYLSTSLNQVLPWQADPVRYVDSLGQGTYRWRIQARNPAGSSSWSAFSTFTIGSQIVFPPVETVPFSDTMESSQAQWARDGFWTYKNDEGSAHSGMNSWWYQNNYGDYDNDQPNSGSLTSPPVWITDTGYYLRFYYRYQTETTGTDWDQRWVQISMDRGPFINLVQLQDDPQISETSSWLRSRAVDLSVYAGHVVRIRFQFSSLDASSNNYAGWGIDDVSITKTALPNCEENRPDDTYQQAFILAYDPFIKTPGEICPNGDYDFYKFLGNAGDRIVADIDAMVDGSVLDPYLYLLDTDGKTVLAENDDEQFPELRDSLIGYTLPRNGMYYLKLNAWKHPLVGGDQYFYTIRLFEDHVKPAVSIIWPQTNSFLPDTNMLFTVSVNDIENAISRLEFYWHSTDWLSSGWELLGSDFNDADGWSMPFDPSGENEGKDAAISVRVYDMAGNLSAASAWSLGIDKTSPTSSINMLAPNQPSNAFLLSWQSSDNLSGIDFFEFQQKAGANGWTTLPPINGSIMDYWVVTTPGSSYSYRMHAVDYSGNTEEYPPDPETTTAVPEAEILCFAPDSYDTSGNDNSPANASLLYVNGVSQFHNFCNPLDENYQDEDWAKLTVNKGQHYLFISRPISMPTATRISLYAQDGTTLIAEAEPQAWGDSTNLVWTSDRSAQVFLRFQHVDGRVIGNDIGSMISAKTGQWIYLPRVSKK